MAALSTRTAVLNVGRLNAFRLNVQDRPDEVRITLDGVPLRVRAGSLTIRDVINDAPNTCALTVDSATPPAVGGRLRVTLGTADPRVLFVGALQAARRSYVGRATPAWECEAIDDTARADWRRPFGASVDVSATTIAKDLIANFAPGFTSTHVQAGLPPVTVTFDGTERLTDALRLLAKLIGGYFYFEDYDLHLFTDAEAGDAPDPIDLTPGRALDDPPISATSDDAQIRTRVYGKGAGEALLAAVAVTESILPIRSAARFNPTGGAAISEWQRFTYSAADVGGAGALVGPGLTPSAPPAVAIADGAGITAGPHTWAYTWLTAAGETLPSPVSASLTVGAAVAAPVIESVSSGALFGGPPAGTAMRYVLFIHNGSQYSPASVVMPLTSSGNRPIVSFRSTADMRSRYVAVYRSDDGGSSWFPIAAQGTPPGTINPFPADYAIGLSQNWTDMTVSSGGGALPAAGTLPAPARVLLTGIALGPAGTTGRRIYRTAGAFGLLLVTGIADNTTTSYTDSTPDASLGGIPPAVDTSGLQPAGGVVVVGAATMPLSSTAWARAGGGWVAVGNGRQVIRYAGVSGNTLTGIPATGPGAIVAPVNFASTITGCPLLLGVTLTAALRDAAPVNIWVQRDDVAAQTELAARVGGAGIVEHLIVDDRRGEASLVALADADLAMYARPIVTVRYTTFDSKSRSGKPVRVLLPALGLDTTLTIQDVTIDLRTGGAVPIRFTVVAGSVVTSLEDMLRRLVGTLEEGF